MKGKKLDPQDPYWPESLGQLYSLGLVRVLEEAEQKEQAEKAFQEYLQAYELAEDLQRDSLLDRLAKTALAAGQITEARKYAQQMLADDSAGWNLGNRIHHGNLILGRIALVEGHLDEAKSRLLLAGQTPGSPQLGSFGPNMQLAKEMLEQGEKEVVLEYLNLCKKFWTSPRNRLEEWEEEIKNDRTPNFGGNLSY